MKTTIRIYSLLLPLLTLLQACDLKQNQAPSTVPKQVKKDSISTQKPDKQEKELITIAQLKEKGAQWADISKLAPDIPLDIRYATTNNFTKKQIYDCPKCLLRVEVAEALLEINRILQKEGYGMKLFDCFRPRAAQQRLWDIMPDKRYVTPPTKGSMHNRGAAVDITLTDLDGKELDMGTDFDVFTRVAWHNYKDLPEQVINRRILLKNHMEQNGFKSITTEWWHYSYVGKKGYTIGEDLWQCDD